MFEFIQEISEARIYKDGNSLKGKSLDDLVNVTFLTIMMLEIMRFLDSKVASSYANSTQPYQDFTSMRTSATDLHNLLVVLSNQDKFHDKLSLDTKYSSVWPFTQTNTVNRVTLPEYQTKRYLKDIIVNRKEVALDRSYFKSLEELLNIKDSKLKNIRRNVADWAMLDSSEKHWTITSICQLANQLSQQNDLYQVFKNHIKV